MTRKPYQGPKAIFDNTDGRVYLYLWFLAWQTSLVEPRWVEDGDGNWLGAIARLPDGLFDITYRFRYHRDDRAWDSADEHSVYSAVSVNGSDEALAAALHAMRSIFGLQKLYRAVHGRIVTEAVEIKVENGDLAEALRPFPWSNVRIFRKGDPDDKGTPYVHREESE